MSKYLKFMNSKDGVRQIFTREKIAMMSGDEFEKNEKRIHLQLNEIGIPTNNELASYAQGKVYVWHAIIDEKTCDECLALDGTVYENLADVPDDPHLNCRCHLEPVNLGIA